MVDMVKIVMLLIRVVWAAVQAGCLPRQRERRERAGG
jgi:hypothetical protein